MAVTSVKTALEALLQQSSEDKDDEQDSDDGMGNDDLEEGGTDTEIPRPPKVNDGAFPTALTSDYGTDLCMCRRLASLPSRRDPADRVRRPHSLAYPCSR